MVVNSNIGTNSQAQLKKGGSNMFSAVNQYCSKLYINTNSSNLQSKNSVSNPTFSSVISNTKTQSNSYLSQLQMKFGSKISVQNLEYSEANINHIGSSTIGTGNVIIAPNILNNMASDPKERLYYEKKIQAHFDTNDEAIAFMAMRGRRIVSRGVVIDVNGKVTYYCSGDYTPEEKARLEKAMKEEDKAKTEKRLKEKEQLIALLEKNAQKAAYAVKLSQMRTSYKNNMLINTDIVL